jgi:hypothetical protein
MTQFSESRLILLVCLVLLPSGHTITTIDILNVTERLGPFSYPEHPQNARKNPQNAKQMTMNPILTLKPEVLEVTKVERALSKKRFTSRRTLRFPAPRNGPQGGFPTWKLEIGTISSCMA